MVVFPYGNITLFQATLQVSRHVTYIFTHYLNLVYYFVMHCVCAVVCHFTFCFTARLHTRGVGRGLLVLLIAASCNYSLLQFSMKFKIYRFVSRKGTVITQTDKGDVPSSYIKLTDKFL